MPSVLDTFNTVYRDYVIDGTPGSGANEPDKADIRAAFAEFCALLGLDVNGVTHGQMRRALSAQSKLDLFLDGLPADPNDAATIQWAANEPISLGDSVAAKIASVLSYGGPAMLTLFALAKTM